MIKTRINQTGGVHVPAGTTAQRPLIDNGLIRYNIDNDKYEGFFGYNIWKDFLTEEVIPETSISCLPVINLQKLILSESTIIVDNISVTDWGSVKWLVTVSDLNKSKIKSFEVHADHEYGTKPDYTIYAIMGSNMALNTIVDITDNNLTLKITNNEPLSVIVYITRIAVPLTKTATKNLIGRINITETHTTIVPSTSKIVDTFKYGKIHAVKWIITITDPLDHKSTSEIFAIMETDLISKGVEYALIGNRDLIYNITINNNLSEVELVVHNDDIVNLFVDITRIPIQTELPPTCNINTDISIWIPPEITIPVESTINVDDQVTIPGHNAVKWLVYIRQPSTNKSGAFEISATRQQLSTTNHVLYGILSTYFNLNVFTTIVDLNMILSITNNEQSSVIINLIRIPVSV